MTTARLSLRAFLTRQMGSIDSLRGRLVRGSVGSVIVKLVGISLSLVLAILLARSLGPDGYGVYAYIFALVSFMSIPAQFGLPALVVRETAKAEANEQWGLMRGIWRWASVGASALSLLIALLGSGIAWLLAEYFSILQLGTFAWGLVLVPLIALGNLRGAAQRGLRKVIQGQLPENILRPAILILFILGGLMWGHSFTADQIMALHVLAAAIAFAAGAWLLCRSRPQSMIMRPAPVYNSRSWLASTLPLALISTFYFINQYCDILILGIFRPADDVGIYRVAAQGAMFVLFGQQAIAMVVAPHFARLYSQGNLYHLQKVVLIAARASLFFALTIALIFVTSGKPILEQLFGEGFIRGHMSLVILSLGNVVNTAFGSVGHLLNMTGHEKDTAYGIYMAAGVNVILNAVFAPNFGVNGVAVATALSLILLNIILWRSAYRCLKIRSFALGV